MRANLMILRNPSLPAFRSGILLELSSSRREKQKHKNGDNQAESLEGLIAKWDWRSLSIASPHAALQTCFIRGKQVPLDEV